MTQRPTESRLPFMVTREFAEQFRADRTIPEEVKKSALGLYERMLSGLVFFDKAPETRYSQWDVENLNLSKCYSCGEMSVWVTTGCSSRQRPKGRAQTRICPLQFAWTMRRRAAS
jgi:hypothetical protein